MSAHETHAAHPGPTLGTHEGPDAHGPGHMQADHGTLKTYVTGFVLAVILTAIPFWLVMDKVFEKSSTTALVVLAFAAVQIVVHMIYFLHMNTKSEGGWSMLALIFTVMLVVIMLSGSIWVMYHLDHNMMPGMNNEISEEAVPESIPQPMSGNMQSPMQAPGASMQQPVPVAPDAPREPDTNPMKDMQPAHKM